MQAWWKAPNRAIALAVVATLALGQMLLFAGPSPVHAQQSHSWVPLAEASIHPGVQAITNGGQCTANFVFTGTDGSVYLGQAAHCGSSDASDETDGCAATPPALGAQVQLDGASRLGTLVYNSWGSMQAIGEQDPNACAFNDFALVAVHPDDQHRVNPSIPFFGGPTGIIDTTSNGDTVYTYGNSALRPGSGAQKTGVSSGQSGEGWTHRVRTTTNPGIPGDSGSPFIDDQGRAFGVLSTLELFPNIGSNGVSDLSRMLAYLAENSAVEVSLALGTLQFDPAGAGSDSASGSAPAAQPVIRLAGTSRIETAVAISQDNVAGYAAGAVVLARQDVAADALAGTPLAADRRAPILLTQRDSLHPATTEEIRRVLLPGGTVYLLGGEGALSAGIDDAVRQLGYTVQRVAGPSRVETAIAVARTTRTDPDQVLLADGIGFADALVAGPAAHAASGVVLLTDGARSHPAVDAYLSDHQSADVVTIGATASTAYPQREAITGADAADTARLVAEAYLPDAAEVGLARLDVFADTLAGGAHIAARGGPVLLTDSGELSEPAAGFLRARADQVVAAFVYGGTTAISPGVEQAVRDALQG